MKIKLGQLLQIEQEVSQILQQKVNLTQKYKLGKLLKEATKEREEFAKVRDEAIKEYGSKTKSGQHEIKPGTKKFAEFEKQINSLLTEDVEVSSGKFPLSIFDNVETEDYYPFFMEFFIAQEDEA